MKIHIEETISRENLDVKHFNNSIYNIKYKKEICTIDPQYKFENSSYIINKIHKIRLNLDENKPQDLNFKMLIDNIFNELSRVIQFNTEFDNIFISEFKNPVKKSTILDNVYVFYIDLNKKSIIKDFKTREIVSSGILEKSRFSIYPLIYFPYLKIENNTVFINFTLKEAYIEITQELNIDKNIDDKIDVNNLNDIFSA